MNFRFERRKYNIRKRFKYSNNEFHHSQLKDEWGKEGEKGKHRKEGGWRRR